MHQPTTQPATLIAVFAKAKHQIIVKHWKRADAPDVMLCGERVALETPRSGFARECFPCLRLKADWDARRQSSPLSSGRGAGGEGVTHSVSQ